MYRCTWHKRSTIASGKYIIDNLVLRHRQSNTVSLEYFHAYETVSHTRALLGNFHRVSKFTHLHPDLTSFLLFRKFSFLNILSVTCIMQTFEKCHNRHLPSTPSFYYTQLTPLLSYFREDIVTGNHPALLPRSHCIIPRNYFRTLLSQFVFDLPFEIHCGLGCFVVS